MNTYELLFKRLNVNTLMTEMTISEIKKFLMKSTFTAKLATGFSELFKWATKIARRYMGKENAEVYGRRNSIDGAVLVRIKPTKILAEKNIAAWE